MKKEGGVAVYGVVLAAGVGQRFGGTKQFFRGAGKKYIFEFSLETTTRVIDKKHTVLVLPHDTKVHWHYSADRYPDIQIVSGGKNRLYSIFNALDHIFEGNGGAVSENTYVAIIDASRPLLKASTLRTLIQKAISQKSNYILTRKVTDFLVALKDQDVTPIDRDSFRLSHTPHIYRFNDIYGVLKTSSLDEERDSAILLKTQGIDIKHHEISYQDIKITYRDDLRLINAFLS